MRNTPGAPVWRRNYYEHIVRNEKELTNMRQYIYDNPACWKNDDENPVNRKSQGRHAPAIRNKGKNI